jgi:tRNA wybutosine-synthesizing protein 4
MFPSDPLPWSWLARDRDLCGNVKFVDVDHEALMVSKCDVVTKTPKMRDMLTLRTLKETAGLLLNSDEYVAIGCDLRNVKRLDRLVKCVLPVEESTVLCIAEVSIAYMHPDDADAIISWSSTLSSDVTFCLLEQASPDRPDNPFTATMLRHFEKLGSPLRTVLKYPGNYAQSQRFFAAGFQNIESQNLWALWSSPAFLSPSERMRLDHIEPFDEWEEFALFASHYTFLIAQTDGGTLPSTRRRRESEVSISSDLSTRTASPIRYGNQWFAYKYSPNPVGDGCTHHGASFPIRGEDAVAVHGGWGLHERLKTTFVHASSHSRVSDPLLPPLDIPARSNHTITTLGNEMKVLVGGRASPGAAMSDCWLQTDTAWERIQDLPTPRYRHRSVAVTLPGDNWGVVVYGGKDGPCNVHEEVLLWDPSSGWQSIRSLKNDPMPRFGATFVTLGNNHGILFGGMRQDGIVCQDFWRWRLIIREDRVAGISFKPSTALDVSTGSYPFFGRFGASYSVIRNEVLIIGGIAKIGCIPKSYEILSISGSFSAVGEYETESELKVACVDPIMPPNQPRPFLIGHTSVRTKRDQTLILGGGAVCFSFGNYYNQGTWLLHDREAGLSDKWSLVQLHKANSAHTETYHKRTEPDGSKTDWPIERILVKTDRAFIKLLSQSAPKILEDLDFGSCKSLWTISYLRSKIASNREVIVHEASSRSMNFQKKDFKYTTLAFSQFLDRVEEGAHLYLRSISSTSPSSAPAQLAVDFPEIAKDFELPEPLSFIKDKVHSSPLRISSHKINMFLHYDVMANVLFQIQGMKKMVLYPPRDITRLDFPPGSTTSRLDIFPDNGMPGKIAFTAGTSHFEALLQPGDALFIPPLWSHAGAPLESSGPNIAVNVFFRNLESKTYAAGRDIYGNRDLAAYEDGRRDIEKIAGRFTDVPRDMARVYLERLAHELMAKAREI